jgi:hypothetical protein
MLRCCFALSRNDFSGNTCNNRILMNRETAVRHRLAPFTHMSRACYAALPRVVSG